MAFHTLQSVGNLSCQLVCKFIEGVLTRRSSLINVFHSRNTRQPLSSFHHITSITDKTELPLQKLLFSATMTQNPEKLAPLQLYKPTLFMSSEKTLPENPAEGEVSNERYILPETLEERMTVCKHGEKPLIVVYLLKVLKYKDVLCFTGSIETNHRLYLLVKSCGIKAAEFSSALNQTQRKGILRDFKNGKLDLLICSDAMSRGMDIDNVQYVISYDPPVNTKTYVHRVGRAARAGNKGVSLTILSPEEVYHFNKIALTGHKTRMHKMKISIKDLEVVQDDYEQGLELLKDVIMSEKTQGKR